MRKTKKSPAATRDDLLKFEKRLAKIFLTKADAKNFATKDDLGRFATKDDLKNFATKDDLKNHPTKSDLNNMREETFRYFDIKTEQLQHDYNGIFNDRTVQIKEKTVELDTRMSRVEKVLHLDLAA